MAEDEDGAQQLFAHIRAVEWNEEKAAANRRKHGIDFDEAIEVFYGQILLRRSDRKNEERWIAIGETDGRVVSVVFTWRGDTLRVISARPASKNEKRAHHQATIRRKAEGQD